MRKRLVYRADDVGYTKVFDEGIYKAFEEGIATSADVMLDSQHTIEALKWLKERPWISVGWHRHLWGRPVLDPKEVPSMVNDEGKFKWRFDSSLQATATYEDAYKEFCAEMELCIKYLGRVPDTAGFHGNLPIDLAAKDVCEKYGIKCNFWSEKSHHDDSFFNCDQQYENLKYAEWPHINFVPDKHLRFHLSNFDKYDPERYITSVEWKDENEVWRVGGHPGFLDDYILSESTCSVHRIKDNIACCSEKVKKWIIDNEIELINQRDLLYGTNEYQNHLRSINSPLYIGNIKKAKQGKINED